MRNEGGFSLFRFLGFHPHPNPLPQGRGDFGCLCELVFLGGYDELEGLADTAGVVLGAGL